MITKGRLLVTATCYGQQELVKNICPNYSFLRNLKKRYLRVHKIGKTA